MMEMSFENGCSYHELWDTVMMLISFTMMRNFARALLPLRQRDVSVRSAKASQDSCRQRPREASPSRFFCQRRSALARLSLSPIRVPPPLLLFLRRTPLFATFLLSLSESRLEFSAFFPFLFRFSTRTPTPYVSSWIDLRQRAQHSPLFHACRGSDHVETLCSGGEASFMPSPPVATDLICQPRENTHETVVIVSTRHSQHLSFIGLR